MLADVGLAASCYQISKTETLPKKNEIAVKVIASTATGSALDIGVTILLVGTPISWGVILLVGAGKLAGSIYKSQFSDADIVNSLGINKICN